MARKPRIGLALGAGSSRGWAHIGAIRALEERGVKPDIICGTSIGALVGAVYASGQLDQLESWVTGLAWTKVVRLMDITWKGGLIRGQRLFNLFRATFQDREISELEIPFGAIATELNTGREIWLRDGKLLDAVRAPGDDPVIPSIFEVFNTALDIVEQRVARSRLSGEPADILITPLLPNFGTMEYHRAKEAIAEGRVAVERMMPLIEQVIL